MEALEQAIEAIDCFITAGVSPESNVLEQLDEMLGLPAFDLTTDGATSR